MSGCFRIILGDNTEESAKEVEDVAAEDSEDQEENVPALARSLFVRDSSQKDESDANNQKPNRDDQHRKACSADISGSGRIAISVRNGRRAIEDRTRIRHEDDAHD